MGPLRLGRRLAGPRGPGDGARRLRDRGDRAARPAGPGPARPVAPDRVLPDPLARRRARERVRRPGRPERLPGRLGAARSCSSGRWSGSRSWRPRSRPGRRPAAAWTSARSSAAPVPRMLPYLVAAALLVVALVAPARSRPRPASAGCSSAASSCWSAARPWFLAIATAFVLALATFVLQPPAEFRDRSFFGVTEVLRVAERRADAADERHDGPRLAVDRSRQGAHAAELLRPQRSGRRPVRDHAADAEATRTVGVAGLGGGALATYADAATAMTFFEIDPVVIEVASDPRYFTYLSDAPTRPTVVEGDARLSFEDEPDRPLRPADHGCVLLGLGAGPPPDRRGDRRRDPDHEAGRHCSSSTSRTATTTSPRRSRPRSRRRA